jgi:hypothetical protein
MEKSDCYVGMKVKVARAVEGISFGYRNTIVEDMYLKVGSGEVLTITRISKEGIYFTEGSLGWDWSWLEPVSNLDTFHNKVKCKYKRVCL